MSQTAPVPGSSASPQAATAPRAPSADEILAAILAALPELAHHHAPGGAAYQALAAAARQAVVTLFAQGGKDVPFGPFGSISFPYHAMGAVDSLDLFGLDELILFAFYWQNRGIYKKTADIGGNIGLHSLVMARCGFDVNSYEPDPEHIALFKANMAANGVGTVTVHEAAVSAEAGQAEFLRLRGNTTGSHLAGAKSDPYGQIDRFAVRLEAFAAIAGEGRLRQDRRRGPRGGDHHLAAGRALGRLRRHAGDRQRRQCRGDLRLRDPQRGADLFTQKTGWRKARPSPICRPRTSRAAPFSPARTRCRA